VWTVSLPIQVYNCMQSTYIGKHNCLYMKFHKIFLKFLPNVCHKLVHVLWHFPSETVCGFELTDGGKCQRIRMNMVKLPNEFFIG
jgi:hypothetical protein